MTHRLSLLLASLLLLTCPVWAQATPSGRKCAEDVAAQLRQERAQLQAILGKHNSGQPVDGRAYGLPRNDFDDATNLTVRQRQAFRRMSPDLDYPASGPLQYPRWAFSLMKRLDLEGAVKCGTSAGTPDGAASKAAQLAPSAT